MGKRRKKRARAAKRMSCCACANLRTGQRRTCPMVVAGSSQISVILADPSNRPRSRVPNCSLISLVPLLLVGCCALLAVAPIRSIDSTDNSVIIETDLGQLFKGIRLKSRSYAKPTKWSSVATNGVGTQQRPLITNRTRVSSDSVNNDVIAFLGIRYASAPVKRLRFMPPTLFTYVPNQVHDGRQFGPICMQRFPLELSPRQMELIRQFGSPGGNSSAGHTAHHRQGHQHRQSIAISTDPIGDNSDSTGWRQAAARESTGHSTASVDLTEKIQLQLSLMADLIPSSGSSSLFATDRRRNARGRGHQQRDPLSAIRRRSLLELDQSEDCLNLNIYTPIEALRHRILGQESEQPPQSPFRRPDQDQAEQPQHGAQEHNNSDWREDSDRRHKTLLPVLVIIHGESFDYGSGQTISGHKFAHDNRLVVVTFNFRLNILGFPPKLDSATSVMGSSGSSSSGISGGGGGGRSGPRGNLGLLDQVALLHWIQANIGSFGGSSANVTLMGVRKGAIFVNLLMLSPLAKGLFSRAIIEDGSALSPMVANNVQAASLGLQQQQQQQQQQVALQHVRLLANLCDCPVYLPPSPSRYAPNLTSQMVPSAARELKQNGPEQAAAGGGGGGGGGTDEARANLLMFECLKNSPVELIMQQIPFGLIDTAHQAMQSSTAAGVDTGRSARFVLDKRWHRTLYELAKSVLEPIGEDEWMVPTSLKLTWTELTNQIFAAKTSARLISDQKQHDNESVATTVITSGTSGGGLVRMTADQLDRLIACLVATKQFVKALLTTGKEEGQQQRQEAPISVKADLVSDLLDDLLGAIYLPSNETLVSPIYAPQLDSGTILMHNSHSLTNSMLQRESPFGRHDLLIGSSVPIVNLDPLATGGRPRRQAPGYETSATASDNNDPEIEALISQHYATVSSSSSSSSSISAFNDELLYPLERFDKRVLDRVGLTDEQSIQQISLFVRTYYRYHQQEITNSIINHYYLNFDQQSSAAGSGSNARASLSEGDKNNSQAADYHQSQSKQTAQNAKQLHLLQALINAYRDSLISVPLIKTALIHSIKQLDALVDPFIGQHLLKFSETMEGNGNGMLDMSSNRREALAAGAIDDFKSFVSQLYDSSQGIVWPIKLSRKPQVASVQQQQTDSSEDLDGVHSTFLYQLGANLDSWLIDKLTRAIGSTKRKHNTDSRSDTSSHGSENDQPNAVRQKVLSEIGQNLADNVLAKLISNGTMARFRQQLGIGCSLTASALSKFDDYFADEESWDGDESWLESDEGIESDGDLLSRLRGLICSELGRNIVAPFVRSGNVNGASIFETATDSELLSEQIDQFGLDCVRLGAVDGQDYNDDHHAVQLNIRSTLEKTLPANGTSSGVALNDQRPTGDGERALCRKRLSWLTMKYFKLHGLESVLRSPTKVRLARGSIEPNASDREYWPVFNVFDQHIATLLEQRTSQSGSQLWLSDSFAKQPGESLSRGSSNDKSGRQTLGAADERLSRDNFDRKLAFWANFIPTLNCSRTQPISPNSLLFSTLASNSTLLNMNVDFNCNHQMASGSTLAAPTTVSSMIETIWAKIRRATLDHISKLAKRQEARRRQMTAASGTSQMNIQQSHHSLRMASAASMTTDMTNGSMQQQRQFDDLTSTGNEWAAAEADHQQLNGSSSGGKNWPAVSNGRQDDKNKSSWPLFMPFDTTTGTSANRRSFIGLWIIASTILVVCTILLTSGWVMMNRRKRQRQQQQQQVDSKQSASSQLSHEQGDVSRFSAGASGVPHDEHTGQLCGIVPQMSTQLPIEREPEAELMASVHLQASNHNSATNRCSSTPNHSITRNQHQQQQQQQQQQLLYDHYQQHQHHHDDPKQQLVQESSGSELEESNGHEIIDDNCAMVVLNGCHQLSSSFIDYDSLAQQQYVDDQGDNDCEIDGPQQPQEIIVPVVSAPRYLTGQQHRHRGAQQQQQVSGGADSTRSSCHHLADCNLVLLQGANLNSDRLTMNDQQQVLSSGSETTTTTNRGHSSVSLVSSSTTTTLTNSNINNHNNSHSYDGGGYPTASNNWRQRRQQQTKKRVKIRDPANSGKDGNAGAAADNANMIPAGCGITMATSNDDCSSSGQLYFNSDYVLTPIGQVNGAGEHQSGQFATTTAGTDYCPIHLANSSNYLLSDTPTSSSTMLNGSQMVNLDCRESSGFSHQFVNVSGNHVVQRYLGAVANAQRDGKSNESPIATVGSLSDFLNMNTNDVDLRTMSLLNNNSSPYELTFPSDQSTNHAFMGSHKYQVNNLSLGNRTANKKRANKVSGTMMASRGSP